MPVAHHRRIAAAFRARTNKPARHGAIFLAPGATYHADSCEPVRQAVARGELQLHGFGRRSYPGIPLPARMLPEVCSIGFWDAVGTQHWGLDWHRNEGIELTYLDRGKLDFLVEDEQFVLQSGDLTVSRPWQRHRVGNPNVAACRLYFLILDVGVRRPNQPWQWPSWLILSPHDVRRLTTLLSHNENPVWRANQEVRRCFGKIGELVDTKKPLGVQTQMQLYINELFLALMQLLQKKNAPLDARLTSTRRSVEMFLSALPDHLETPWTLEEMARQCGLGRSRFTEYCRQITNLTPSDYLAQCRVEAGKQLLLAEPRGSITDVALSCGFQSSQYFATVFHRRTGVSPRDYRLNGGRLPTSRR
jgi:AraC-like DNA-binding protein